MSVAESMEKWTLDVSAGLFNWVIIQRIFNAAATG